MRISAEHAQIELRLRRKWRAYLRAHPAVRRKRRTGLFPRHYSSSSLLRVLIPLIGFIPPPLGWLAAILLATWLTALNASQLLARGEEEALISYYGGNDASIMRLTRRWLQKLAVWRALDATIFLGIWWMLGRAPLWLVAAGIPCYVVSMLTGARLLASVAPPRLLNAICNYGGLLIVALLMAHQYVPPAAIEGGSWLIGALSPAGWTILMLRGLLQGELIFWLVAPLLVACVLVMRSIARTQDHRLLVDITRSVENPSWDDDGNEAGPLEGAGDEVGREASLVAELADFRKRAQIDYPMELPPGPHLTGQSLWVVVIIMAAAVNARYGLVAPDMRYLIFAATLVGPHVMWLPFLGVPIWLQQTFLSPNRVASAFVVFPVRLRGLIHDQIKRDLNHAMRAAPYLFALAVAGMLVALPGPAPANVILAAMLTGCIVIQLPLRWFHLASYPLGTTPKGAERFVRIALILAILAVFFCQIVGVVAVIAAVVSGTFQIPMALLALVPGVINIGLAMAGVSMALSAYEKRRIDVIKPPPRS